jgi:hypothetical protein
MDQALMGRRTGWFADRGIITINLLLILCQISSYATGYDGSMMSMSTESKKENVKLTQDQTGCNRWMSGKTFSISPVQAHWPCTSF